MCGIYGYCGIKPPSMDKLKILGIFNVDRGKDSCGIFIEDEIFKGIGTTARFENMAKQTVLPTPKSNFTVIGHTRNSSVGAISIANAHPFSYHTKDKLTGVFVHNGTIKDWRTFFGKHGHSTKGFEVDSDMLGLMIANKHYAVLKDYEGAATFMYHDPTKPNTLLVFKGATFKSDEKNGDRPLFGMKTKYGIYFSSMEISLQIIKEPDDEIFNVETNKLIYIKDGKISKVTTVDRPLQSYTSSKDHSSNTYLRNYSKSSTLDSDGFETSNINHEKFYFSNSHKGKFYWSNGRYWRNGHLPTGEFKLDDDGNVCKDGEVYYFYRGILLNTTTEEGFKVNSVSLKEIFTELKFKSDSRKINGYRDAISRVSKQPFDFLLEESKDIVKSSGYSKLDAQYANGTYLTKFANKQKITYKTGNVEKIVSYKDEDSRYSTISERINFLNTLDEEYWESFNWANFNPEAMTTLDPKIKEYYIAKKKKYGDMKKEDNKEDENVTSDLTLSDVCSNIIKGLKEDYDDIKETHKDTELRKEVLSVLESTINQLRNKLYANTSN